MQEASHQKVQEQINYRSGAEKTLSCVIEMGGMGSAHAHQENMFDGHRNFLQFSIVVKML